MSARRGRAQMKRVATVLLYPFVDPMHASTSQRRRRRRRKPVHTYTTGARVHTIFYKCITLYAVDGPPPGVKIYAIVHSRGIRRRRTRPRLVCGVWGAYERDGGCCRTESAAPSRTQRKMRAFAASRRATTTKTTAAVQVVSIATREQCGQRYWLAFACADVL